MAWLNGPLVAPTDASVPATSLGTSRACVPGRTHMPKRGRRRERKYWLFEAASQGCLRCVKHYLEVAPCRNSVPRDRLKKGKGRGVVRDGISARVVVVHG